MLIFFKNGAGTTGHSQAKEKKKNLDINLHSSQKFIKIDHRPNVKHKTIKLLEKNLKENLDDLGFGK